MTPSRILHLTVDEFLTCWPEAACLFKVAHTACLGCVMAPFCLVSDVLATYGLETDAFLSAFSQIVADAVAVDDHISSSVNNS